MQEQITQLNLEILALCFAVKAKGHDAFYSYSPHVDWVTVNVHVDGWYYGKSYDKKFDFLFTVATEYRGADHIICNLTECKTYLEGLIG